VFRQQRSKAQRLPPEGCYAPYRSGYVTENLKPFTRTASSESEKICFERFRMSFWESEVGAECVLLIIERGELTYMDSFLFSKYARGNKFPQK
jgi:hypothetical protein